ncbi:MAG: hypothetical protein HZB24_08500, partial [Desulfobacterales bacterium]|nr:hypothetical protein [Desulfobacterales bacterium]
ALPAATPDSVGPFTALWNARITMDGLHALSQVFLLVQPDQYTQRSSELTPIVNPQVEAFWQETTVRLQAQDARRGPVLLPGQTDAQGQLIALRPLFYCRHRRRFAHPPCPQCGGALTLCRDDRMLRAAGLQAYSESLARYLFCPACQGQSIFYAREASPQAPSHLCDARQLVEAFSRLLGREELGEELPCVGCPETTACFGPQALVHRRMTPLCFYPFHMLMLPAPTIWSDYVFKMWLKELRREIQALVFNTVPAAAAVAPQPVAPPVRDTVVETGTDEEDARIAAILKTILSQWPEDGGVARKSAPAVPPPPKAEIAATPPADEDGDSVETIILGAAPQPTAPARFVTPPPSSDMEKTVLIQPPAATAAKPATPEDLQATVLISPAPDRLAKRPAAEDLDKTVLIRPSQEAPKDAAADDLEQTVLMTSSKPVPRPPQAPAPMPPKSVPPAPPQPPADDLAETVIISPDPKGRRSKP